MSWTTQLRKGALELAILNALNGDRLYGYDIVRILRGYDGVMIADGTVYPILSRLKADGRVRATIEDSPDGPPRKYSMLGIIPTSIDPSCSSAAHFEGGSNCSAKPWRSSRPNTSGRALR